MRGGGGMVFSLMLAKINLGKTLKHQGSGGGLVFLPIEVLNRWIQDGIVVLITSRGIVLAQC